MEKKNINILKGVV